MNVTVSKDDMASGLSIVTKASPSSTTTPILTGVMLDTTDSTTLRLTATDLQLGIEYRIPSHNLIPGRVVVPAKLFSDLVRKLPSGDLSLEYSSSEQGLVIKILSDLKSEFSIRTFDADEFPPFPDVNQNSSISCPNSELRNMIKMTAFAASTEERRPFLTGIYITVEDGSLKFVSTDSWRLAYRQTQLHSSDQASFAGVIIPARTLMELAKALPDNENTTTISISSAEVCFVSDRLRLVSKLVEGQFPNYKAIIPKTHRAQLTVNRTALLAAAERASLMVRDRVSFLRMSNANEMLIITSNSPEVGKGYEEIPVVSEGDEITVVLDASYLIDVLKTMDCDTIDIQLQNSQQAVCITDGGSPNYIHLIMPVKVPA